MKATIRGVQAVLFAWAALALLAPCPQATASLRSEADPECAKFLLDFDLTGPEQPVQVLQVDFGSLSAVQDTSHDAVTAMSKSATNKARFEPGSPLRERFTDSILDLADALWDQFVVRLNQDPNFRKAFDLYLSQSNPEQYDFNLLYNSPGSAQLYAEYVSVLQRYFSTLLVGYTALHSDLPLDGKIAALDLGTGVGDTIAAIQKFFPNAEVTGLDKSAPLLRRTLERFPSTRPLLGDFEVVPLPFASKSFDLITMICSANQYLPFEQFLLTAREALRILKPGGYVVVEYGPWNRAAPRAALVRKFLREMSALGFEIETYPLLRIDFSKHRYYPIVLRRPLEK